MWIQDSEDLGPLLNSIITRCMILRHILSLLCLIFSIYKMNSYRPFTLYSRTFWYYIQAIYGLQKLPFQKSAFNGKKCTDFGEKKVWTWGLDFQSLVLSGRAYSVSLVQNMREREKTNIVRSYRRKAEKSNQEKPRRTEMGSVRVLVEDRFWNQQSWIWIPDLYIHK